MMDLLVRASTRDELSEVASAFNEMQAAVSRVLHQNQLIANTVMESSSSLLIVAQESTDARGQIAEFVQVCAVAIRAE